MVAAIIEMGQPKANAVEDDRSDSKDGNPKDNFEPGIDILAKATVFGEGARGSLMKQIAEKLDIFSGKMPQVFETGIEEVIQLPEDHYFKTSKGNDDVFVASFTAGGELRWTVQLGGVGTDYGNAIAVRCGTN